MTTRRCPTGIRQRGSWTCRFLAIGLGFAVLALLPARPDAEPSTWQRYKGLPVSSLKITGLGPELAKPLEEGLALAGRRRLLRTERPLFFAETLEKDLARARLFLARHGHPHARVQADATATPDGKTVRVTLKIEPGPQVRVQRVQVSGLPEDADSVAIALHAGDALRDDAVERAVTELERTLREQGHALAKVEAAVLLVDSTGADVTLATRPGPRYHVDSLRVEGVRSDLVPLVRATVRLRPGETYSPSKLREAERGLRELDLFRLIRLGVEPLEGDRLLVRCELSERQPRTFATGIGYYSDEQLRLDAEWRHRNLLRGGRGMRVAGRASRFLQMLRADVVLPRLAGARGIVGAALRREDEDAYELFDARLEFTVSRRLGARSRGSAGIAVAYIDVQARTSDPTLDDPVGLVTSVPLSWLRDTSEPAVYPERGTLARIDAEVTPPGIGSVTHYARVEGRLGGYRTFLTSTVLAARLAGGVARPLADTESVLASRRLFGGGSRSMRGFGRRRLGPQDASGEPLGGEAKVEASVEWRFPIFGRLEGAAFVDAAQVWEETSGFRFTDLEWAAGPALMVRSPVGPVRVDWGILLEKVSGEPRSVVHFSVGHPY